MGLLGDAFPDDFRKKEIEQRLIPGAVLYLQIQFPEVTKDKFLVLVTSAEPEILTFIVNSETNDYIRQRPELSVCQVTLDKANHAFLSHDSQITCHQVHRLKKSDVVNALLADMDRMKGYVSQDVREEIIAAVKHAVTIAPKVAMTILGALEAID